MEIGRYPYLDLEDSLNIISSEAETALGPLELISNTPEEIETEQSLKDIIREVREIKERMAPYIKMDRTKRAENSTSNKVTPAIWDGERLVPVQAGLLRRMVDNLHEVVAQIGKKPIAAETWKIAEELYKLAEPPKVQKVSQEEERLRKKLALYENELRTLANDLSAIAPERAEEIYSVLGFNDF